MEKAKTIGEYFDGFPQEVKSILLAVRTAIVKSAPGAVEVISYGIPTYKLNGKNLIHFGGFKNHVGLYPGPSVIIQFKDELEQYKQAKGSIQFPFKDPIPIDLIGSIVKYSVEEEERKKK